MQAGHNRLRIGLASLVALAVTAAMAAFAGTATAGFSQGPSPGLDPQSINTPYLAWRGEQVRLVKCFSADLGLDASDPGRFFVEDWSGLSDFKPEIANGLAGTVTPFPGTGEQFGRTCYGADFVSLKPGLAIIKLKVHDSQLFGGGEDRVLAEHQFLVGWMNLATNNVEDIGPTKVPASSAAIDTNPETNGICDITVGRTEVAGNCQLNADAATTAASQNQVQVTVTGTIPMENNFDEINAQLGRTANTPLRMPTDWAALAGVMARSALPGWERTSLLWDIHDEFTGVPGGNVAPPAGHPAAGAFGPTDNPGVGAGPTHQTGGACSGSSTTMDEVDNCLGGGEFGSFSRFIYPFAAGTDDVAGPLGTFAGRPVIGPYDPLRQDTYLPNGTIDAGDAPMPAARVDFILNGDGMLLPIDKHVVYSRNGAGDETTVDPDPTVTGDEFVDYPGNAHNLWAPFYGRYIPATAAQDDLGTTASGEDAGFANNFTGGLTRGLYHYWDFVVGIERNGALSDCPPFSPGIPASEAFGINTATVYTDEHGEARVGFNGGVGFGIFPTPNENGACDLQAPPLNINPGGTLGTGTISAIARYPGQPVTAADVPGDQSVTKTITSLFNKSLTCVRKTADLTQALWLCTATANGIDGSPFVGETVCFSTTGERIIPFSGTTVPDPRGGTGPAVICLVTNADGKAVVEVVGKGQFNVVADFVQEGIFRRFDIAGSPLSGTTGGNPGTGNVGGTGGTPTPPPAASPPPAATPPSLGNTGSVNKPTAQPAVRAKLMSARIIQTKSGRKLSLRLKSAKPTAKVRIVLKARNGKVLAAAVRTVRTNRVVNVPNLRIARGAVRITVSVLS